jgi:iron complex transport system ATP-binding protein
MKNRLVYHLNNQKIFDLESAKLWGFVGPNGVGKTTLLKQLGSLLRLTEGARFEIHQKSQIFDLHHLGYKERARWVSYRSSTIQTEFPIKVSDFVSLGACFVEEPNHVAELLQELDLFEKKDMLLQQLSTGEQQRVLIAQAFNQKPSWLIFDETLSHLDLDYQAKLGRLLKLWSLRGQGIVVVHHDLNWVRQHCEFVLVMDLGGRILAGESRELLSTESLQLLYPRSRIKESLQIQFSEE